MFTTQWIKPVNLEDLHFYFYLIIYRYGSLITLLHKNESEHIHVIKKKKTYLCATFVLNKNISTIRCD